MKKKSKPQSAKAVTIICGKMEVALKDIAPNTIDSCVCDPPYGLRFMGKHWDYDVPTVEQWREVFRVLKPGGHLLAFGGTRTYHRMVCAIEDAGFEIRDQIGWVYGSGFPKSLDVSKAIDKSGGVDVSAFKADLRGCVQQSGLSRKEIDSRCGFTMRFDTPYADDTVGWGVSLPSPDKWEVISSVLNIEKSKWSELIDRVWRGRAGEEIGRNHSMSGPNFERTAKGEAVTDAARQWQGWGTALKPAWEPIVVARKPLSGTVADNVQRHGVGGINIGGCRIGEEVRTYKGSGPNNVKLRNHAKGDTGIGMMDGHGKDLEFTAVGRWPANVIHDGSDEVLALFPQSAGQQGDVKGMEPSYTGDGNTNCYGQYARVPSAKRGDAGSAARFFYCAKASKRDRDEGLEAFREQITDVNARHHSRRMSEIERQDGHAPAMGKNTHPTVKPTALMRYLCRLVTPPNGIVCDPFMGSGSTGKAARLEGFRFLGIERDAQHCKIAHARISAALRREQMELGLK